MKTKKWLAVAVGLLVLAQVVLIFVSWLLSATMTDGVRPLLSTEGLRWFCANFTRVLGSPVLVWLLLLSMAWGCLSGSDIMGRRSRYRRGLALRMAAVVAAVVVGVCVLLSCVPGAVLLSATGHLWPSPFSRALVPIIALSVVLVSAVYGWVARVFCSFADVVASLCEGIAACAPLFVLYVLVMQLYESVCFAFL